jgi:protein SCO1/2
MKTKLFYFSTFKLGAISMLVVCMVLAGCREVPHRTFEIKGKIVSVSRETGQVTVAHEKIEGYMDAMTMPFNVKDKQAFSFMAPGQKLEATLVVQKDRSWIEDIRVSGTESVQNSSATIPIPEPGDKVPDFSLLNQDNHKIHLSQYRGRPLLITFIYTRCPLPDYCPLMSGNFAAIHFKLQSLPQSDALPHLLTVSFDTDHDSPPVLREYAARWMKPVSFDRWEFATGSPDEIRAITSYFGLVYEKESGQIVHSLVTALIGPDGRLFRLYHGNQWRPEQILEDLSVNGK